MSSMFGNLAARFAQSHENLATEALAYMLAQSPAVRRAVNEMATTLCTGIGEARSFRTQYAGEDHTIPDLAGFDHTGKAVLIIENKFWAGLTSNQPAEYLKRLPENEPGLLLFVVPPRRLHALWPDLVTSAARKEIFLPPPSNPHANACACKIGNKTLAVTSWQAVLDQIEGHARTAGESAIISDVGQLRGLCEEMNSTGYMPATLEELTNVETSRQMIGLSELVQELCDRAVASKIADAKLLRPTHFWHGAGRYLRMGAAGAWVGLDHRLWAAHGIGPLWVVFTKSEFGRARDVLDAVAPWLSSNPVKAFEWDGAAAIPLRIIPGATRDIVVDTLHTQLVELHNRLKGILTNAGAVQPPPADAIS